MKIELYTCSNQQCDFHNEGRRWQVYADVPAVEVYDIVGTDGTASKEIREGKVPTAKNRSRCPSCGELGTKVPAEELRDIPTGEAGGYA